VDDGFETSMDNFSTATSADHEIVDVLTKTIATLTDQLAAKKHLGKAPGGGDQMFF
jgi:hypothetical protein